MNGKRFLLIALLALASAALLPGSANAQFTGFGVVSDWLPLIFIAIAIGVLITASLYMAGSMLNNSSIKVRAANQFGQLIGAAIIAVIVIAIMYTFGSVSTTSLFVGITGNSVNSICTNTLRSSQLPILNPIIQGSMTHVPCDIVLTAIPGAETGVSSSTVVSGATNRYVTPYIDYGIASVFTVIANMTDQAASNMNAFYMYEDFIGFLTTLEANTGACEPGPACAIPITPRELSIDYSYSPFNGYSFLSSISRAVEAEAVMTYYIFLVQLLIVWIILYIWPYMLAAGIIFEASSYTKGVGGMLIAMVIAMLIVFPTIFSVEYAALGNGTADISPIGAATNSLPTFAINGLNANTNKQVVYNSNTMNFFVFPNVTNIINYNKCLPYDQNIGLEEAKDSAVYLIPFAASVSQVWGVFVTGIPDVSWVGCQPENAINTLFAISDVYGIVGVSGVILPLLNIFIMLSALKGISMLLGGDTNLLGIGKFV